MNNSRKLRDSFLVSIVTKAKDMVMNGDISVSNYDINKFAVNFIEQWYDEEVESIYSFNKTVEIELTKKFGKIQPEPDIKNLTVKDLRGIISNLPDDYEIIIPVFNRKKACIQLKHVRSVGVVTSKYEPLSLCLCGTEFNKDIEKVIKKNRNLGAECTEILF